MFRRDGAGVWSAFGACVDIGVDINARADVPSGVWFLSAVVAGIDTAADTGIAGDAEDGAEFDRFLFRADALSGLGCGVT